MDARTIAAKLAVEDIVKDLSDRKGLDNEWDQIDDDIKDEIKTHWIDIILTRTK
jgi:hypothetical protein